MLLDLIKVAAVLTAAGILGSSFLAEVKKNKLQGGAWYRPYISFPGLIICFAILLPVLVWWINKG